MTGEEPKSFSQVAFLEAVARRVRVDIVLKPVTAGTEKRLHSRFLAARGKDRLVIAVPRIRRKKVFVPVDWELGMAFSLGEFFLQARTTVLGHCQYQLYPTRRVDALEVCRPAKILSIERRKEPREQIDHSITVGVSLWCAESLAENRPSQPRTGMLSNRSQSGIGVRLTSSLSFNIDAPMIVRLEEPGSREYQIFHGTLKHCTPREDGSWIAGLGELVELKPGQAVPLLENLTIPPR